MSKTPMPWYVVKIAYGPYIVGHKYQPYGLARDRLIRAGVIELVPLTLPEAPAPVVAPAPAPEPVAERTVPRATVTDREVRRYSNRGGK